MINYVRAILQIKKKAYKSNENKIIDDYRFEEAFVININNFLICDPDLEECLPDSKMSSGTI